MQQEKLLEKGRDMSRKDVISISSKNNFKKTTTWLKERKKTHFILSTLQKYGEEGVAALKAATPKLTGKTAESWYYEIREQNNRLEIVWCNSNVIKDYANIAILIQYGHGTKNGGYVYGVDYINPALKPIFQKLADEIYMEVKR